MTEKPATVFHTCRHHVEPLHAEGRNIPNPLRYIDVVRTTHTTQDMFEESRVDESWNIDTNRNFSESWTRFTQFQILNDKPSDGQMRSGERLTKLQATTRTDHVWPEFLLQLNNARKL